jgi:uncharacterized lipoprotein YddW (UPF0748 family)
MHLNFSRFLAYRFLMKAVASCKLRRPGTGFRQKALSFCILILLVIPFQLSQSFILQGLAAEGVPVLLLNDLKETAALRGLLDSMEASGYTPRHIREDDFSFNISPKSTASVVIPVGNHASPEAINMLSRYIRGGGRVVLIPLGSTPDTSIERLFALVGLSVNGLMHASQPLDFQWKGMATSSGEHLDRPCPLLLIKPSGQADVLATWGSDLPAIVSTSKGAVLNWPWGRELSRAMNVITLYKAMSPGKSEPFILHQQNNYAELADKMPSSAQSTQGLIELPKIAQATPASADETAFKTISNPGLSGFAPDHAALKKHVSGLTKPGNDTAKTSGGDKLGIDASKPARTVSPNKPLIAIPVKAGSRQFHTTAGQADESAETEVLNNILGIPAGDSVKAGTAPASGQTDGDKSKPHEQQHFSFLSPDAASVLAPSFDYGVYSMNMRKLDDTRTRLRDAMEASKQLALDLPEEQIKALMKEADLHKRKFETLYLAGQTQQGLDENVLAQHAAFQALALTSRSPKVEGRAIWLDRGSIIASGGPDGLRKRIRQLRQAGINMLYFETINAGFPIYPSKLVRHNPMVNNWDPLKVAVEEGHKQGMEVHAWVWAFAVGNRRHNELINQATEYPGPILTEAGLMNDALRNRQGGLMVDTHQHEFWLSPASPRARAFLLSLYQEIVSHYAVDGLQLDYIRYPFQAAGNRMGFEAVGRERFEQETGKSLDNLDESGQRAWTAWKAAQVSSFVQQVSRTLKKINPNLKLSAAVFPMRRESRVAMIQQDWETWVDNGWIDTLSPMSYTTDPERLQDMFEMVQHSAHKHPLIYPGIALQRLDGGQLVQHLEALRQKGGLGSTMFAGSHLDDEKATMLASGPYKVADCVPPHQDVVKSLQTILEDYQEKLSILQKKGGLKDAPADQLESLQSSLKRMTQALDDLDGSHALQSIPLQKLLAAQRQLDVLDRASQTWSQWDKLNHPYRAEYFERDISLLNEIMGYAVDKLNLTKPTLAEPDAPHAWVTATP